MIISQIVFELQFSNETEKMFEIKTIPSCPTKILQNYQADQILEINIAGKFTVKTKDREFSTSILPFMQTDHLFNQIVGKATFHVTKTPLIQHSS